MEVYPLDIRVKILHRTKSIIFNLEFAICYQKSRRQIKPLRNQIRQPHIAVEEEALYIIVHRCEEARLLTSMEIAMDDLIRGKDRMIIVRILLLMLWGL